MNNTSFETILKNKRESFRSEIRKQEINNKMFLKRQFLLEQKSNTPEKCSFELFLQNFKFMENYTDPKLVPNKVYKMFFILIVLKLEIFRNLPRNNENPY